MNYLDFPYLSERWTMHLVGMNILGGGVNVKLYLYLLCLNCVYGGRGACRLLFDLILYVPSTIFQLLREGSSWVEPVQS